MSVASEHGKREGQRCCKESPLLSYFWFFFVSFFQVMVWKIVAMHTMSCSK